jgi:hypothetical protein
MREDGGLCMLWRETTPEPLGCVSMDSLYRVITYDKILPCYVVRSSDEPGTAIDLTHS